MKILLMIMLLVSTQAMAGEYDPSNDIWKTCHQQLRSPTAEHYCFKLETDSYAAFKAMEESGHPFFKRASAYCTVHKKISDDWAYMLSCTVGMIDRMMFWRSMGWIH